MDLIALFLALVFAWSLVSKRLERSTLTAPIAFTSAGALVGLAAEKVPIAGLGNEELLTLAEVGLVLLLFADAARADLRTLRRSRALPVRLLSVGMLLTIALGAAGALAVFPALSLWEAGILAAILAPTDAGLGQVIVNSPRVPPKIRQALNVEAGLNDGLAVPFLLFFMAVAGGGAGGSEPNLFGFVFEQLGLGLLVGIAIGGIGGWLLGASDRRGWMTTSWQQLGVVALPLLCLLGSEACGASMFIAAFVAGLAVQLGFARATHHGVEFTESWGQLFNSSIFFLFGTIVPRAWSQLDATHFAYAVLSLTAIRMLPVAVALLGAKLDRATVLFVGWFGPRGLASIVLGLVYLAEHLHQRGEATIRSAVIATVLLSILAHGISAAPGAELYARRVRSLPPEAPEKQGSESD